MPNALVERREQFDFNEAISPMQHSESLRPEIRRIVALFVCFSLWPLVAFSTVNIGENIEYDRIALFAAANIVLPLIILSLAHFLARGFGGARVYYVYPVIIIAFYFFSDIMNVLTEIGLSRFRHRVPIYGVGVGLLALAMWLLAANRQFRNLIVIVGGVVFVSASGSLVYAAVELSLLRADMDARAGSVSIKNSPVLAKIPKPDFASVDGTTARRPNVYFILPDAHVSPHILRTEFGFEPSEFLAGMKNLGFKVYDRTWSNYPATVTSVSSTLSMQYLYRPDNLDQRDSLRAIDGKIVLGANRVVEALIDRGYKYVRVPGGFITLLNCSRYVDQCIEKQRNFFEVGGTDIALLNQTPVPLITQTLFRTFVWKSRITEFSDFESVLPIPADGPFFLVFHAMSPHSPNRFTADCEPRNVFEDASEELYLEQVKCVDKQILSALKRLVELDPSAIVVVQSDHGYWASSQHETPMLEWTERRKRISMSFLGAYRFPRECQELLPPEMSQVNAFRIVLGCLDGKRKPLLENKYYLPIWLHHQGAENRIYQWSPETGLIR